MYYFNIVTNNKKHVNVKIKFAKRSVQQHILFIRLIFDQIEHLFDITK